MAKSVPETRNKHQGKGGRRKGYASANEIQDMRLFDEDPGKEPSQEDGAPPVELDDEFEPLKA
jgi:hypothetical protein